MCRRLLYFFTIVVTVLLLNCCYSSVVKAEEKLYYIHSDHLGSTTVVTDEGGNVVSQQSYYPYGETRSSQSPTTNYPVTERQYTGQVSDTDQTGLYYYNARYYNPRIALFIQVDTFDDPKSKLNRYSYVYSNPTNYNDSSGNCPWCWIIISALHGIQGELANPVSAGERFYEPDPWMIPFLEEAAKDNPKVFRFEDWSSEYGTPMYIELPEDSPSIYDKAIASGGNALMSRLVFRTGYVIDPKKFGLGRLVEIFFASKSDEMIENFDLSDLEEIQEIFTGLDMTDEFIKIKNDPLLLLNKDFISDTYEKMYQNQLENIESKASNLLEFLNRFNEFMGGIYDNLP